LLTTPGADPEDRDEYTADPLHRGGLLEPCRGVTRPIDSLRHQAQAHPPEHRCLAPRG
jgi:hypothetical protein